MVARGESLQTMRACAVADNAYRQAIGLSPEQYVQLEKIGKERAVCLRDKCTLVDRGDAVPTVQVK